MTTRKAIKVEKLLAIDEDEGFNVLLFTKKEAVLYGDAAEHSAICGAKEGDGNIPKGMKYFSFWEINGEQFVIFTDDYFAANYSLIRWL